VTAYCGIRQGSDPVIVTVDGDRTLPPRFDLWNHSPVGFEWGYCGSGPAQLALALCAHVLHDDERALEIYQDFKFSVVSKLPLKGWLLTDREIRRAIERCEAERRPARAVEPL
jgi:hypothetical protein